MFIDPIRARAVVLAALVSSLGCVAEVSEFEQATPADELEQEVVGGIDCTAAGANLAACSDTADPSGGSLVYTSLARVGRTSPDTAYAEIAQTFQVTQAGIPGRVSLKLRALRSLAAGAVLTVDVRTLNANGSIPTDGAHDIATGTIDLDGLTRGFPTVATAVLTPVGSTATPFNTTDTYALVLRTNVPASAGSNYIGVSSLKSVNYPGGAAYRRTGTTATAGTFAAKAFDATIGDVDLAFVVTVNDGLSCASGYELQGGACADVDECQTGNGGCDPLTLCTNTPGSRTCGDCPAGYIGTGLTGCESALWAQWPLPDSSTLFCTNGASAGTCPTPGGTAFGQDGNYSINPPAYTVDGVNGTVTDGVTGLVWQREVSVLTYTWANATAYCDGLVLAGAADWRLPGNQELMSIVDYGRASPAIDVASFPGTPAAAFWSSTPYTRAPSTAWLVFFNNGTSSSWSTANQYYVRCVR